MEVEQNSFLVPLIKGKRKAKQQPVLILHNPWQKQSFFPVPYLFRKEVREWGRGAAYSSPCLS